MIDDINVPKRRRPTTPGFKKPLLRRRSEERAINLREPVFQTPEQVANKDITSHPEIVQDNKPERSLENKKSQPKKRFFKFKFKKPTKKQLIIGIPVAIILLGVTTAYAYVKLKKAPVLVAPTPPPPAKIEPPKPLTEASRLTGAQVNPDINNLPIVASMIENSPDARPQSGLKEAGLVFEAIAEGGITRFIALYQQNGQPAQIGPVRSVRPYYIDIAAAYDAGIAHAGGSPEALSLLNSLKLRDLDQFANAKSYDRVNFRYAPHNLYTSIDKLNELMKAKGFTTSSFVGFPREESKPAATPTAKTINIDISSALYDVSYTYDPATNTYKRSLGGTPHNDGTSSTQLSPNAVIVLVSDYSIHSDGVHSVYRMTGSGKTYIFQNGIVVEGSWNKADRKSMFSFLDAAGTPIKVQAGQAWISMVKQAGAVTYQP